MKSFLLTNRRLLGLILISLIFALLRAGPLNGTKIALILTILFQVYLPGYLFARALDKLRGAHPISRFAWVLVAGLSLTICLGGAARYLQVSMLAYTLILHSVMLALTLIQPKEEPASEIWKLSRRNIPLYLLLALCCLVALGVGYERSRFRFNGYEDQTVFIAAADWLAHDPDDPALYERRIGVPPERLDRRWETDGWTYTHAAWVWASGVSTAELIWYDLTPLFVWAVPLAVFALAYELTRREQAAAFCAAALTLAGLMTLDSLVYRTTTLAFGQFALFQLNTLRTASTALVLPLALMAALAYLRQPQRRDLILIFLAGLAIATMHPRQIMIFQISAGATTLLWWLAHRSRQRFWQGLWLLLILVSLLFLPLIQRVNRPSFDQANQQFEEAALAGDTAGGRGVDELWMISLPGGARAYILRPEVIFYHPIILLAAVCGLLAGFAWRRSLAAQYVFASTLAVLLLLFVPGLTALAIRIITVVFVSTLIYILPVALSLGLALDFVVSGLKRLPYKQTLACILLAAGILVLLFEPIPIPASARDQIRASNRAQAVRDIRPFDQELLTTLQSILPDDRRSIITTPNHVANYIIESIQRTFITSGRASSNLAYQPNERFFGGANHRGIRSPWLDSTDLEFLRQYGVTHLVMQAADTRLPQLMFQPERFSYLASSAGFVIFSVNPDLVEHEADSVFGQMNAVYANIELPRWDASGFALARPADPTPWQDVVQNWNSLDNDLARYGLAITYTLMGDDQQALPLWAQLHADHPDLFLFTNALAHTRLALDPSANSVQPLLDALENPQAAIRVLAARELLSDTFFYLLTDEQIQQAVALHETEAITWDQLAVFDQPAQVRERIVLLLSKGLWDTAAGWVNDLDEMERSPQDFVIQASVALANGDTDQALAILMPTTDDDWTAANRQYHPDRWENNTAAQMYFSLLAERAIPHIVPDTASLPSPVSPIVMTESRALYVMQPEIAQNDDTNKLRVTATFGNPHGSPYPVKIWRIQVTSPDASVHYAALDAPATFIDSLPTRASVEVDLPPDMPELTPARVFIEPLYSNTITFGTVSQDIILNRPESATVPPDAAPANAVFGDNILLKNYRITHDENAVDLTLFWESNTSPTENYQIFVHVIGPDGSVVTQSDSTPFNGRYPTSQWRPDAIIADHRVLAFEQPLTEGDYSVWVGIYRLPEIQRLPVQAASARTENDSLLIDQFSIP